MQKERWSLYWRESLKLVPRNEAHLLSHPPHIQPRPVEGRRIVLPPPPFVSPSTTKHAPHKPHPDFLPTQIMLLSTFYYNYLCCPRGCRTKTDCLPDVSLELEPSANVSDVRARVAQTLGWPPVEDLYRMRGFEDHWEKTVLAGKELAPETKLGDLQLPTEGGLVLTTVRKELWSDGWRLLGDGDEVDSSSEEDEDMTG